MCLRDRDAAVDGEHRGVLDAAARPLFNELLFGRRRLIYVAFDLLIATAWICDRCRSGTQSGAGAPRRAGRSLDPARLRRVL